MSDYMGNGGRWRRRWVCALAAVLLGSVLPAQATGLTERGQALVEFNCARCHAVGKTDKSSHPDAPAFRTLSKRYPITDLEEALAEGISTGHPDMPEWVASPDQIEAIIAYINSLQQP
ncbi:cytochrome c [Mesorhizobium sp. Root102]|uniref:c-type cytochrome n=1 Tax=Mesorhizobium sp. Root102 TaxID=1736422 RepID=UPI000A4782DB|nr:cytochrome c [Mesorhizobium sp. Root102]